MKKLHAPNGICRITTGEEGTPPKALDHGIAEIKQAGKWVRHPSFPTGQQQWRIELLSDIPEFIHRSHLACYTAKTPFCFRSQKGDESLGVAQRRRADGSLYLTECLPSECPLRINYTEPESKTSEISKNWTAVYPYAKLIDNKGRAAKCKSYGFLTFALLDNDGNYAHPRGEFCQYVHHSDVNAERFNQKLRDLYIECGGELVGLQLILEYSPFEGRMGKQIPAWDLRVSSDVDFQAQRERATKRRMLRAPMAPPDSTALVKADEDNNLALSTAADFPDAIKEAQAHLHVQAVSAEYIDPTTVDLVNQNPIVKRLIERCRTNYATETALPREFGTDAYRCIKWYFDYAQGKGIFIGDIIDTYGYPMEPTVSRETTPQNVTTVAPEPVTPIQDAEYTEIDPEPSSAQLERSVRGQVADDDFVREIESEQERLGISSPTKDLFDGGG